MTLLTVSFILCATVCALGLRWESRIIAVSSPTISFGRTQRYFVRTSALGILFLLGFILNTIAAGASWLGN